MHDPLLSTSGEVDRAPAVRRLLAASVAAVLALAACGSDDPDPVATDPPPATEMGAMDDTDDMDEVDEMDDMDMASMNMGDANATPAGEVEGAVLARGDLELLDTRPAGYDDVAGTAVLARHAGGTTVTIELTGLPPEEEFISHVHAQACASDNAGPHYQFEVGGAEVPPNEIHLAFASDADGNGFMTAENEQIAGLDAVAIVVHPAEFIDNKAVCADLVEDEAGAAAELLGSS